MNYFRSSRIVSIFLFFLIVVFFVGCHRGSGHKSVAPESAFIVSNTSPASGASNVATDSSINVTFSENVDQSTLTASTFTLRYSTSGVTVPGKISCSGATATLTPSSPLVDGFTYIAEMTSAGVSSTGQLTSAGIQSSTGQPLKSNYSWFFTISLNNLSAAPWSMYGHDRRHTGLSSYSGPQTLNLPADQIWSLKTKIPLLNAIPLYGSPAIGAYAHGTVYFGGSDSRVYALDGATGIQRWAFTTGGAIDSTPAIGTDGTVYIGSSDGSLYAIDGVTGTQEWAFTFNFTKKGARAGSPVIGEDGTVYFCGDGTVFALDGTTGSQKWLFFTNTSLGLLLNSPAIGPDGTVYFCGNGNIFALDGATGILKWKSTYAANAFLAIANSPAIGADGTVYFGGVEVSALDGATGTSKWTFTGNKSVNFSTPAIGPDGTVYIGANGAVYALDGSTGSQKWEFPTNYSYDQFNGLAIGADGTVYAGDLQSKCYALDGATGTLKWIVTLGSIGSCPAIGANGILYVTTENGTLYAIGQNNGI